MFDFGCNFVSLKYDVRDFLLIIPGEEKKDVLILSVAVIRTKNKLGRKKFIFVKRSQDKKKEAEIEAGGVLLPSLLPMA